MFKTIAHKIFLSLHPAIRNGLFMIYSLIRFGYPLGYWTTFCIEINSDCNRDCWFCWRNSDVSGLRKNSQGEHTQLFMPTDMVLDIIDQACKFGYRGNIAFNLYNEPILDERLLYFARYAQRRGLTTELTTNGDVIKKTTDHAFLNDLQESFDKIHIGLYDFTNEKEKEEAKATFIKRLYKVKFLDFWGGEREAVLGMNEKKFYDKYGISMVDAVRWSVGKPCLAPRDQLLVRYDGKIVLACPCGVGFAVDDIREHKLWEYWFSYKHMTYVKTLSKAGGRSKFEECKRCPSGGDYPEHIKAKLAQEVKDKKEYFYHSPRYLSRGDRDV